MVNDLYGEWIKPCGERIFLVDSCSHESRCSYGDAHDEGWIAIIYGTNVMCCRINPGATSNKCYNILLKCIKEHEGEKVILEDIFMEPFGNVGMNTTKKDIVKLIQQLKRDEVILTERWSAEPYDGYEDAKG
ncbi:MAG: hypothetical protein QQN63_00640, partial [Nitrosopumilus sp.]